MGGFGIESYQNSLELASISEIRSKVISRE